jgi:hypothetical protein
MYVCMYVYMYVCMCVCMYMYILYTYPPPSFHVIRKTVEEHCHSRLSVDGLGVGDVGDYRTHCAAEDL